MSESYYEEGWYSYDDGDDFDNIQTTASGVYSEHKGEFDVMLDVVKTGEWGEEQNEYIVR